jgi:hypothetical protein
MRHGLGPVTHLAALECPVRAESGHDDNGRLVRSPAMRDYSTLALQLCETCRNFTVGAFFPTFGLFHKGLQGLIQKIP